MRNASSRHVGWLFSAIAFFLLILSPSPAAAMDLILNIDKQGDELHVRAVCPYDTVAFSIASDTAIVRKLEQIYDLIERRPDTSGTMDKVGDFFDQQIRTVRGLIPFWKDEAAQAPEPDADAETLGRLLDEAGHLLFDPVASLVAAAGRIQFVVTESCLYYPFDAAYLAGVPLFLKKPVVFSLTEMPPNHLKASVDWRGTIISDPAADPADGAAAVAALFPRSAHHEAGKVDRRVLTGMPSVDFVLVSAAGGVDGIQLSQQVLRPDNIATLNPKLVYFDCDLYGINLSFIEPLRHAGVDTYVAPVCSRAQGETSAQTMIRFFRSLRLGETPSRAMLLARKTLFDASRLDGDNMQTALRAAFPFRVYQLN